MQQELIEMLDKMVKYFDELPSDSYYYRETVAILDEAEKLVEKAKKSAKEPAVPDADELESALERLVERCNTDQFLSNDDAVIHAEATLERVYKSRKSTDAPSQQVTLTDRQFDLICQAIDKADTITMDGDYMMDSGDCIAVVRVMQALFGIAALREKEGK